MDILLDLLKSKKAVATLVGILVVMLTQYLKIPEEMATTIAGLIVAYVVGQGIADHGKEAEKIRSDVAAMTESELEDTVEAGE